MAHLNQSKVLQFILHTVLWIGVASFIYRIIRIVVPVEDAVQIIAMRVGIFMLVFYFHSEILIPRLLFARKYLFYGIGLLLSLSSATAARVWYEKTFLMDSLLEVPFYNNDLQIVVAFVAVGTIAVISLVYRLGRRQLQKERHSQELIARQREAEIQLLRAQLNPHFLFNMLNNIYSLSISQSPKTPELILKLSDLLRYVTYESQEDKVLLSSEVRNIQVFIDIFRLKSEGIIPVKLEVQGDVSGLKTEPLLLLPLVENAFKHCNLMAKGAFLHIHLIVTEKGFNFSTSNSKNQLDQQKDKQGGVGLENIQKRLSLNSSRDQYRLEIRDEGDSFQVELNFEAHGTRY